MRFASVMLNCVIWVTFAHAQNGCDALKDLKLDHATVTSAKWMEAGPVPVPMGFPPKPQNIAVARRCEVDAVSRPTSDSEIHFSLWLPAREDWNGKYLQRGNGGWAGAISISQLIGPLAQGYAVAATDDGHTATAGPLPDASWAIGHPEKLIDFGFRAVHETAALSKEIVSAYYSKPATRAYFQGCSDGGREALMEAERYPEDFVGIIAGAPANHWTNHFAGFLWNEMALSATKDRPLTADQMANVQKAALAACDALDGVKDGLIDDPRKCHFDPSALLCQGAAPAGSTCLTQLQIDAFKKIYAGPKDPVTGMQIYPGYEPGTEGEPGAWIPWIVPGMGIPTSIQAMFGNSMYAQAVHENPQWDWKNADLHRELQLADEKTGAILNAYNPDLRTFRAHGGKLIQYHGWGDAAIAPRDSIDFYEKVEGFFRDYPDPRSTNATDVRAFYRLFMVPGMGHCAGGPGPTSFGNDDSRIPADAEHDVLKALDRWVMTGAAPDQLIGTGKVAGAALTRPLCAYPNIAKYQGTGDTNAAESFACVPNGKE